MYIFENCIKLLLVMIVSAFGIVLRFITNLFLCSPIETILAETNSSSKTGVFSLASSLLH